MGSKEKDIILNSFFYTNYNYCFLVWNFCPAKSLRKIEKIEESGLKIIYDDFDRITKVSEKFRQVSGKCTMEVKRLPILGIEIFKTLSNLNPQFMKVYFKKLNG